MIRIDAKKTFLYLFLAFVSFLFAFWFDRYYIFQEKEIIFKNPLKYFNLNN